jgi:hypothetical protein
MRSLYGPAHASHVWNAFRATVEVIQVKAMCAERAHQKAEDENDDEDDWGRKQAGPGKEMLARVVAMPTRLIDRFDPDDTAIVGLS